jgi:hypothetical protein
LKEFRILKITNNLIKENIRQAKFGSATNYGAVFSETDKELVGLGSQSIKLLFYKDNTYLALRIKFAMKFGKKLKKVK